LSASVQYQQTTKRAFIRNQQRKPNNQRAYVHYQQTGRMTEIVTKKITSTGIVAKPRPDFNSAKKISHLLLNGKNYLTWAKTSKVTLKGKGLLGFISGARERPAEGLDAQEDWDMLDGQTMTLISNSIEPQLIDLFVHCETTFELWKEIKGQYSNQKNHSHIFSAQTRDSKNHTRRKSNTQINRGGKSKIRRNQNLSTNYH
jgi:gag-polypeptide of LTR copia-type